MNTEPLITGRWNDPHMLAGFVATFTGGAGNAFEAKRYSAAWGRYATTGEIEGNYGLGALAQQGNELAEAIVAWQKRADELNARFLAYDRAGNRIPHAVCRQPIDVTLRMFSTTWGNPAVWYGEPQLWLARTWRYADIVAPWRPITDDVIREPRKFCRPIPSPVPADVRAALDACLLAGEVEAAKNYYQAWREAMAQENRT